MSRGRPAGGVELVDGPCAGTFSVRRAPYFLRAVKARSDGRLDLLDQLNDEPRQIEDVFVYELDRSRPHTDVQTWMETTGTFICGRGGPPGSTGTYRWRADVAGEELRETAAWRAWARAQAAPVPLVDGVTHEPVPAGQVRR